MRLTWGVGLLAAAGAATLLAGCGIRVSAEPTATPGRTAARSAATQASAISSPCVTPSVAASCSPSPSVSASPSGDAAAGAPADPEATEPTRASRRRAATIAAAERRVEAGAAVCDAVSTFDQLAATMVTRSGVPGAAVAVVAGDTVMYSRCFGLREIGSTDAVDDATMFQLGPLSSAYTTTLLAALAGEGELRWDQPVRLVWRGFRLRDRWATNEGTFRDLAADRSGLPAYAGSELLAFGYGRKQVLRRLRYLRPVDGFRAAYAPQEALVTAAATAAEHATGSSWSRMLGEYVLAPLGDTTTVTSFGGYAAASDKATPHHAVDGSMVAQDPCSENVLAPSLGVSSSLSQLVKFARLQLNQGALGGRRVAPADLLAQTLRPTTAVDSTASGVRVAGLGWRVWSFDGKTVATAGDGLATGSAASVSLLPDEGVAVIVLANAYPEGAVLGRALTKTLVDLIAEGTVRDDWYGVESAADEEEEAGGAAAAVAGTVPGARGLTLTLEGPAGAPTASRRRVYTGVYENRYYGRVTVRRGSGDGLDVTLGRGVTLRYVPWAGDVWRETTSGTAAVFDVQGGRAAAVSLTLLSFDGRNGAFTRVD